MTRRTISALCRVMCITLLTPVFVSAAEDTAPVVATEEGQARQLRIYKEALLAGSTEEVRSDAAVGLLLRADEASQQILVDALKASDNPVAQRAVCQALITSRGLGHSVVSREVYLESLALILQTGDKDQAMLAAEALMIYEYRKISGLLDEIVQDPKADKQGRINGIYALKIRPEPAALRSLIGLLGDADPEVVQAAEDALQQAFGIPVGTSRAVWQEILKDLQKKSPDDIRRERLLRQEMKLRQIQADRDRWQKLYLSSLDKQYESLDAAGRSGMIVETLASELGPVRVWALGKTMQFQAAENDQISQKLFTLLADEDRDVRLAAAKVLNNMSALNPAEALLTQFKREKDPEVALALFEALGEACFFAFSPGSKISLSKDIKMQTLDIAAQYLNQDLPERARKGAEVIRKILELNNLPKESIKVYLDLLYQRYERAAVDNGALKADLLGVMAHLCGQGSQKSQACGLYYTFFTDAVMVSDNPALRLAAVRGLIAVDKVKALELFKGQQLNAAKSLAVRQAMVELAGEVGGAEDLGWLLVMLNENGHSEEVFASMKSICERQTAKFIYDWYQALEEAGMRGEYIREVLDLAEKKASAENDIATLRAVQSRLIQLFYERKDTENALFYLKKIDFPGVSGDFSPPVTVQAFQLYLHGKAFEEAQLLLRNQLQKSDFPAESPWVTALSEFFGDQSASVEEKTAFLTLISSIQVENRPQWVAFIEQTKQKIAPEKPVSGDPAAGAGAAGQ